MSVEVLTGEWSFEEFSADDIHSRIHADALATVRDGTVWSQPASHDSVEKERFRIWCCHFPEQLDNSGFVGWLATAIKQETGSGVFVICGYNCGRGGIYDYWGCPSTVSREVLAKLQQLNESSLNAVRMRPVGRSPGGMIDADTVFDFSDRDGHVVASYSGGRIRQGFLAGTRVGAQLTFRYVQTDPLGVVDAGESACELSILADGRVRLTEHFQWASREGHGTNVIEESDD